jgi:hypothetical protein
MFHCETISGTTSAKSLMGEKKTNVDMEEFIIHPPNFLLSH